MFGHHFDSYFHMEIASFVAFISAFINITSLSSAEIAKTFLSLHINLNGAFGTDEVPHFITVSLHTIYQFSYCREEGGIDMQPSLPPIYE